MKKSPKIPLSFYGALILNTSPATWTAELKQYVFSCRSTSSRDAQQQCQYERKFRLYMDHHHYINYNGILS